MSPPLESSRQAPFPAFRALVAASLAALCGCSDEPPLPTGASSLLHRKPDEVVNQVGVLEPDARRQWGRLGNFGWEGQTGRANVDGRELPFVWSRMADARLTLPAGPPRDRTLSLVLWGPPAGDGEARTVNVRLNTVSLGELPLPERPEEISLAAPAPAWVEGNRNLLELVVDDTRELSPEREVGIAVARVAYDEPHEVRADAARGQLALRPQTNVAYDLEELTPMRVVLKGKARGSGELAVTFARIDPGTGDEVKDDAPDDPLPSIRLDGQRLERAFRVPPARGKIIRLRLGWRSEAADSEFAVEELLRIEETAVERTPIVFISIDTLAAKHLPTYGYGRDTAPNLARFASEAVVFEHCVTNAPWTLPSYMSVMTGLYPYAHRLKLKGPSADLWEKWYLAENRWTLAELLRSAGYETAGFADNAWITERFGFPQGFEAYDTEASRIDKTDPEGGIRYVTGLARKWLDRRTEGAPFFLFLHAFDVHGPYSPPKPFAGRFHGDQLSAPERTALAGGMLNCFCIIPEYVTSFDYPKGELPPRVPTSELVSAYDEGIAMVDASLAEFFDYLRAKGLYERSIIIVSADHGETMDRSDFLFGHGVLDETVLHVPLLIRMPGARHAGLRVAETVHLVDLYPTVLDLLGMEPRSNYLHGRSLLPVLEGEPAEPRPTFTEGGLMQQTSTTYRGWKLVERVPAEDSSKQMLLSLPDLGRRWKEEVVPWMEGVGLPKHVMRDLRRLDFKVFDEIEEKGMTRELFEDLQQRPYYDGLIFVLRRYFSQPSYELYDLRNDPMGLRDVSAKNPEKVEELKVLLHAEAAKRDAARDAARPPTEAVELSEADIADLAKVGYAEGGDADGGGDEREDGD